LTDDTEKTPPAAGKKILNTIVLFFGIILFIFAAALGLIVFLNSPPGQLPKNVQGNQYEADNSLLFEIFKGESARLVGNSLQDAGLIRSSYFWFLLTRIQSRIQNEYIKAGTYRLVPPMSQLEIFRVFVSGKQILIRTTVPEGVTLKKTALILEENGICTGDDFLSAARDPDILSYYGIPGGSMEGYLFPDTYFFPKEYPASKVIRTMADNFYRRLALLEPESADMTRDELAKRVIIASIVEREYRQAEEAPLIAGVFYNRLNIGMALQSCATVEYVITEIEGRPHPDILFNRDIEIRNPYNTYMTPGLPPGPISSPGATALEAAFHPARTDYLYFRLADPVHGTHYFSRTLDDHIKAGMLYLKNQIN